MYLYFFSVSCCLLTHSDNNEMYKFFDSKQACISLKSEVVVVVVIVVIIFIHTSSPSYFTCKIKTVWLDPSSSITDKRFLVPKPRKNFCCFFLRQVFPFLWLILVRLSWQFGFEEYIIEGFKYNIKILSILLVLYASQCQYDEVACCLKPWIAIGKREWQMNGREDPVNTDWLFNE